MDSKLGVRQHGRHPHDNAFLIGIDIYIYKYVYI